MDGHIPKRSRFERKCKPADFEHNTHFLNLVLDEWVYTQTQQVRKKVQTC